MRPSARCLVGPGAGAVQLGRQAAAGAHHQGRRSVLRMLLVLGARAVLVAAKDRTDAISRWAVQLQARVGYWKAIVAIAAKNARMCWAVLKRGEAFKLPA